MVYLIGYRGRGLLVWPLAAIGPLLAIALEAITGRFFILGLSLGLLCAGIAAWILGRKWNAGAKLHTFGPMKFETWGIIFAVLGLLLMPAAINAACHGY